MLWRGGGGYKRRQRGRQKTKRARRSVLFCGGLGRLSDAAYPANKNRPAEAERFLSLVTEITGTQ